MSNDTITVDGTAGSSSLMNHKEISMPAAPLPLSDIGLVPGNSGPADEGAAVKPASMRAVKRSLFVGTSLRYMQ